MIINELLKFKKTLSNRNEILKVKDKKRDKHTNNKRFRTSFLLKIKIKNEKVFLKFFKIFKKFEYSVVLTRLES